jgi:DNA-binding transcriptional MerR regulator
MADGDGIEHLLITATDAATLAGVAVNTICTWAQRGYLVENGTDPKGRARYERRYLEVADHTTQGKPLYRYLDVARAELATRKRARRLAA